LVTKSSKRTLNEKKIAFQSGHNLAKKQIQTKLRKEIRHAQTQYRTKVERPFQSGNMKSA